MALATNKWAEACMQLILLDEGISTEPPSEAAIAFRQKILHLFSLLNAVASNYLRDGMDLRRHYSKFSNPLLARKKQLSRCATQKALPYSAKAASAAKSSLFPEILRTRGYGGDDIILITQNLQAAEHKFRRDRPLHNFFGYNWGPSHNRIAAEALPLPVIGGISEAELAALEVTPERVRLVVVWLHRAIMARSASFDGLLPPKREEEKANPSPMAHMGRCMGLLSDGVSAWTQAKKIADTPFPFPHAHLVAIALVIFAFSCPVVMVSWSGSLWTAVLMDLLAVLAFWSLNEVSVDVEDPFIGASAALR